MDATRDGDEHAELCRRILARYLGLRDEPAPSALPEEYLHALRRVEEFPCNRPGADKSWVLRLEEAERCYFERLVRKPGA